MRELVILQRRRLVFETERKGRVEIKTCQLVSGSHLAPDVLVNQMVFALVVEDNVHFLCTRATNIRT